jgi:hypothetical protein
MIIEQVLMELVEHHLILVLQLLPMVVAEVEQ